MIPSNSEPRNSTANSAFVGNRSVKLVPDNRAPTEEEGNENETALKRALLKFNDDNTHLGGASFALNTAVVFVAR